MDEISTLLFFLSSEFFEINSFASTFIVLFTSSFLTLNSYLSKAF